MSMGATAQQVELGALQTPRQSSFIVIEGGAAGTSKGLTRSAASKMELALCVVALFVTIALCVAWRLSDTLTHARIERSLEACELTTVTVMPGDSLWGIAEQHGIKGCTTAELVRYIEDENSLSSASLHAGMQLLVPVYAAC